MKTARESRWPERRASFRREWAADERHRAEMQCLGRRILPGGNDKLADAALARACGAPAIERVVVGVPLAELDDVAVLGVVLKPRRGCGGKGVFVCHESDRFRDVRAGEDVRRSEFLRRAARVRHPWMVEHFVPGLDGGLPHDLKFYAFYGEVVFVVEDRRGAYCWYSPDGAPSDNMNRRTRRTLAPTGFDPVTLEHARRISLAIPSPFCRIDFLHGRDGAVFSELTPGPGARDHFYDDADAMLGEAMVRARARLFDDLLEGKRFDAYLAAYGGTV